MEMDIRQVSVVVPTFKRAHLLNLTLPAYLQDEVLELIVVDDCSPDNTESVVKELQKTDSRIKYLRDNKNSKQTFSKNVGKLVAKSKYIYFGDDDSILMLGSIRKLLAMINDFAADIVGSSVIYMNSNETLLEQADRRRMEATSIDQIVDIKKIAF